jgi:hypothetical protein
MIFNFTERICKPRSLYQVIVNTFIRQNQGKVKIIKLFFLSTVTNEAIREIYRPSLQESAYWCCIWFSRL